MQDALHRGLVVHCDHIQVRGDGLETGKVLGTYQFTRVLTRHDTFADLVAAQGVVFAETGDEIDTTNTRLGEVTSLSPRVTLQLGRHLQLRVRHNFSELETKSGERVFEANVTDARRG